MTTSVRILISGLTLLMLVKCVPYWTGWFPFSMNIYWGTFKTLPIGANKDEIRGLICELDVNSLAGRSSVEFAVHSTAELSKIRVELIEGLQIRQAPKLFLDAYFQDGVITELDYSSYSVKLGLEMGERVQSLIKKLESLEKKGNSFTFVSVDKGYSHENKISINPCDNDNEVGRLWLLSKDRWFFRLYENSEEHFDLYFERGALKKIKYDKYLREVP